MQPVRTQGAAAGAETGDSSASHGDRKPNRLIREKSPYLQQHAHNPVDWYPWGEEAFAKAHRENKPVFLSIGYSTCHWCHVMERESFENEAIAAILNERFVAIKVDREERPDVDEIYMTAVQALTQGGGGWPLSVWLLPDGKPFYGGTYFPPDDKWGRRGFASVLVQVSETYQKHRSEIDRYGAELTETIRRAGTVGAGDELPDQELLAAAGVQLAQRFDPAYGGFSRQPKFPPSMAMMHLLRQHRRTGDPNALHMTEHTLERMWRGGMFDHLGGGFARYSTDSQWLVPHFEKMLYDNALLARVYLEAYQVTERELYADVAKDILRYVLRDMTSPRGGFYSAEDADSEGEEGKFYVWTPEEVALVLGEEEGRVFSDFYGVSEGGNFEGGTSILHRRMPIEAFADEKGVKPAELEARLAEGRGKLLREREQRPRPLRDEKILAAWNGLMISSMAYAYQVLGGEEYRQAAERAADFVLIEMTSRGRLLRRWMDGQALHDGYSSDYAFMIQGLLDLYEATFEIRWLAEAVRLADDMDRLFWDDEGGGYFMTGHDAEPLIARTKDPDDSAIPSGNSVAAWNGLRLAELTGRDKYRERSLKTIAAFRQLMERAPSAYPMMLVAFDFAVGPTKEVVVVGDPAAADTRAMLAELRGAFVPNKVVALTRGRAGRDAVALVPMLDERVALDGKATAYVCESYACKLPTTDPKVMLKEMGG